MKLSSLFDGACPENAFGVVVDDPLLSDPPDGLRRISLVAPLKGGTIDDDVMDVAIGFAMAHPDDDAKRIEITLEIAAEEEISLDEPADGRVSKPHYLAMVARAPGCSLSLLPPVDDSEEAFEAYCCRIETFARLLMPPIEAPVLISPISDYLVYLGIAMLNPDKAASFRPEDGYIVERFEAVMTPERSDAMKARIRSAVTACFEDGATGFEDYFGAAVARVLKRDEDIIAANLKARQAEMAVPAAV